MRGFFLPGDTFAPRIPCGFSSLLHDARRQFSAPGGEPTDWQKFGGAERRRVEFYYLPKISPTEQKFQDDISSDKFGQRAKDY